MQGLHGPLTLVTAPAGFGKTTLLAACIRECDLRVAWLSLDKNDDQIEAFLRYIISALQSVDDALGGNALQLLADIQQFSPEAVLTSLLNDLDSITEPVILVLDDYQFLSHPAIHKGMRFLLEHCPPSFHLVIASRSDPPLLLSRLRARAQMVELRAADLSFSETEAAQFLNEIMGLQLDAGSIAVLEKRTEGWVTGLQMAALSMRNHQDVHGAIAAFSGTNRYILDYLLEEVLASQPAETQRFLLFTSVLAHFSAPLCDAVLGLEADENPARQTLAYLEQANIFLVPLDMERRWYRYHHLFADLLQTRLKQTFSRAEINTFHQRAACWYQKNGFAYEAIHHASLIPDDEWVERLIEQNYMEMFQRRDSASIRAWTGALSKDVILKSPKLSIHEAMSLSWIGRLHEADFLLKKAEQSLQGKEPTPERKALLGHLAYVQSRVTAMQGDYQQAIQLCHTALKHTLPENQALLGGIGVMLGYAYFLAGDFESAARVLAETIDSGVRVGAVNTTIGAYCVLGRLHALRGQLHQAHQTYQAAEKFVHAMGGRHRGARSIVDVGFAEVFYAWNDLETAQVNIEKGLAAVHFWGKADDIALAHTLKARIQQAQGNAAAANETLEKAVQVIRTHGVFPEARQAVETTKIRLQLDQGDWLGVNHWLNRLDKEVIVGGSLQFEDEQAQIVLARVSLAQKKCGDALDLLSHLAANAQSAGRTGRLIEILILTALAQQQMGETAPALHTLEESLALAEPGGYIRIYLDEGQPVQTLLMDWLRNAQPGSLQALGRFLLAQFDGETMVVKSHQTNAGNTAALANEALAEPLSPRELEVLALIARGKTNPQIAEAFVVARGTVKAQAASIYRKLDVTNRTEAVARARQLGILS